MSTALPDDRHTLDEIPSELMSERLSLTDRALAAFMNLDTLVEHDPEFCIKVLSAAKAEGAAELTQTEAVFILVHERSKLITALLDRFGLKRSAGWQWLVNKKYVGDSLLGYLQICPVEELKLFMGPLGLGERGLLSRLTPGQAGSALSLCQQRAGEEEELLKALEAKVVEMHIKTYGPDSAG